MSRPLRIGVVGAGVMGGHHARKLHERVGEAGDVVLAGIADRDRQRAEGLASELGVPAHTESDELFARADAVVVAVTAVAHFEVVQRALEAGLDVLVEKPIAATLGEAQQLVELARRHSAVLQVGHQEWFNPALRVVREHIDRPRFAEIHRMGGFPERGTDVDVVRDLMIHDIEILQQLLGAEPERVEAVGVPVLTDHADIASARLVFPGGCVANLTASRVSVSPMRKFRFFQRDVLVSIDFLEQSSALFRRVPDADGGKRIEMQELKTDPEDALAAQLDVFVRGLRERDVEALGGVSGAQAARALYTALRVIEAMPDQDASDGPQD